MITIHVRFNASEWSLTEEELGFANYQLDAGATIVAKNLRDNEERIVGRVRATFFNLGRALDDGADFSGVFSNLIAPHWAFFTDFYERERFSPNDYDHEMLPEAEALEFYPHKGVVLIESVDFSPWLGKSGLMEMLMIAYQQRYLESGALVMPAPDTVARSDMTPGDVANSALEQVGRYRRMGFHPVIGWKGGVYMVCPLALRLPRWDELDIDASALETAVRNQLWPEANDRRFPVSLA